MITLWSWTLLPTGPIPVTHRRGEGPSTQKTEEEDKGMRAAALNKRHKLADARANKAEREAKELILNLK